MGSINFCFQALIDKGWVKIRKFGQSKHKMSYVYLLTPGGIAEKSRLTADFLKRKVAEYEALHAEIDVLKSEVAFEARAKEGRQSP